MNLQNQLSVSEHLKQNDMDNDFRQIVRVLDLDYKDNSKPLDILVVGCLEEPTAQTLAELGHNVVGIDLRDWNAGDIKPLFETPKYTHIKGDIRKFKFDQQFDLIISISVIEHIGLGYYKDEKEEDGDTKAMNIMAGLLKPGGRIYITVPIGGEWYETYHWRLYTLDTMSRLTAGLNITRQEYWFTSYQGQGKGNLEDVAFMKKCADLSLLLTLEK